jgi:hypothetical protein
MNCRVNLLPYDSHSAIFLFLVTSMKADDKCLVTEALYDSFTADDVDSMKVKLSLYLII